MVLFLVVTFLLKILFPRGKPISQTSEVHRKMTTKQPAKVMTLCVVSTEGDVLTHFFEPRKKVNAATYCEVLTTKVIPWMKDKSNSNSFVFRG